MIDILRNETPANPDDDGIISFDRFETARVLREKEKKIKSLQRALLEAQEKYDELDGILSFLENKYGRYYGGLGEVINDETVELEIEFEKIKKGLYTRAMVVKLAKEIEEMKKNLEQWKVMFPLWEQAAEQIYSVQIELYKLMGEERLLDYYLARGIDHKQAKEIVDGIIESIKFQSEIRKQDEMRRIEIWPDFDSEEAEDGDQ